MARVYLDYQSTTPISSSLVIFEGEWVFTPAMSFNVSGQEISSSTVTNLGNDTVDSGKSGSSSSQNRRGSRMVGSSKSMLESRQSANGQSTQEGTVAAQTTFDPSASVTIPFTGKSA